MRRTVSGKTEVDCFPTSTEQVLPGSVIAPRERAAQFPVLEYGITEKDNIHGALLEFRLLHRKAVHPPSFVEPRMRPRRP